ncbi:MAG: hypothetical protein ACRC8P_02315 [Spiroplasma sp.]
MKNISYEKLKKNYSKARKEGKKEILMPSKIIYQFSELAYEQLFVYKQPLKWYLEDVIDSNILDRLELSNKMRNKKYWDQYFSIKIDSLNDIPVIFASLGLIEHEYGKNYGSDYDKIHKYVGGYQASESEYKEMLNAILDYRFYLSDTEDEKLSKNLYNFIKHKKEEQDKQNEKVRQRKIFFFSLCTLLISLTSLIIAIAKW